MRNVIIHYHLFKNAGTSIDKILANSFADRWLNWDKVGADSKIHASELSEFVKNNPHLVAVSSHHAIPPVPVTPDTRFFPIVFLRHPIIRARSAYLFEWQKEQGVDSPIGTFKDYVQEKISGKKFSVISDFHTNKLGSTAYSVDGYEQEDARDFEVLQRAKLFLDSLPYFGLVENFYQSLVRMHYYLHGDFSDIQVRTYESNVTQSTAFNLEEKINSIAVELGEETFGDLMQANSLDLELYKYANSKFYSVAK